MDAKKTGTYLAELRRTRGMTQQEAADRLGVSNKTVSKWENGAGLPDITVLPALAELYGVWAAFPVTELLVCAVSVVLLSRYR